MKIVNTPCDKYGAPIEEREGIEVKETRISFLFTDGDNWHFQLKNDVSKEELKSALLGVAELIEKTLKG